MCYRQLGLLDKANFSGCTDLLAKELDSWLPHNFSAAGVPTNADECLEADQSDLAGHSARFLMGYGICSTCKILRACSKQLCCQEVNTIVGQSTSFLKLA